MIYLDNAATTYPKPLTVYEYVDWLQKNMSVNTGRGSYSLAREAAQIIEETKYSLAKLINAPDAHQVYFTSSATLAANEIIGGFEWDRYKVVYVSPFEHNAIMRPLELFRKKYNFKVVTLPFDGISHELDYDEMVRLFSKDEPDYVFLNQVSNVTGTIIPVKLICESAKHYGAKIIIDGSQAIGSIKFDYQEINCDYVIFAGHKSLYSIFGVGGFVKSAKEKLNTYITGGTGSDSLNLSDNNLEVGSPNIIAIGSLLKSIKWIEEIGLDSIISKKRDLITELINGLKKEKCILYLPSDLNKHAAVISFNVPDYLPSEVGTILDQDFDIAVRTGFHCAPLVHKMIGTEEKKGTVRVSVGYFNTEKDIESFIKAIRDL